MIKVEIDCQKFPKVKSYKNKEVKDSLKAAHHNKCCYCETKTTAGGGIDHFRPKSVYYWLKNDCENLLWACSRCNVESKGAKLPVKEKKATEPDNVSTCNQKEELMMYNPARSNEKEWQIEFNKKGEIFSVNPIMQNTIDICKLNDEKLVIARREVFQTLEKEIYTMKKYNLPLTHLQKYFVEPINKDKFIEYIAFRKYIVRKLLNDLLMKTLQ